MMKFSTLPFGVLIVCGVAFTSENVNSTRPKRQQAWIWSENNSYRTTSPTTTSRPPEVTTENPCEYKPTRPDYRKPGRRISEAKCLEYAWERFIRPTKRMKRIDCFLKLIEKANKEGHGIGGSIGGRDTDPGEFPHMGALGWRILNGTWVFKCGCSLISPKFALTAAHCSKSPGDSNLLSQYPEIVRLGDKNIIDHYANGLDPVDAKIIRIIVHPQYSSPKKYFDIALVELDGVREFTKYVQPACLWSKFDTGSLGTTATQTGWGVIETATRKTSPELQAVDVDIIELQLCDSLLKPHCNRHWCGIVDHQLCAGKLAGGKDACQGDSGGPLQMKIPLPENEEGSMHFVIGVTSFGIGCARPNLPGVYTRVSSFVDWIESVVWPDDYFTN